MSLASPKYDRLLSPPLPHVMRCGAAAFPTIPKSFRSALSLPTPEQQTPSHADTGMMSWHSGTSFDPPGGPIQSPHQTSPEGTSPGDDESPRKRKRSSLAAATNGDEGSQPSPTTSKARHQPGVKRACNDCRQQKVRVLLRKSTFPMPLEAPATQQKQTSSCCFVICRINHMLISIS